MHTLEVPGRTALGNEAVSNLKSKLVRGGAVTITFQAVKLILQTGSVMILARLLSPADFGLQAMVVAMIGFLGLFRDAGLSMATVQREVITHEQTSTLFWINFAVGIGLAALAVLMAPILALYFKEPRLLWVAVFSGAAFIFNGLAAQHQALLARRLRFTAMATIDTLAMAASVAVGAVMAKLGFGYWALVAMAVCVPFVSACALWITVPWLPGPPKRGCGIRSMLHLGGTATGISVIGYFGYNSEKILLGRFWGASALGLYGRAFQLANLPLQQLSLAVFNLVFTGLSRVQSDAERVSRLFLKSYSLILSASIPVTISSALFAGDIIPLVLGPKWSDSIPILRLLAPTMIAFALTNPLGWFLLATGRAFRSFQITCMATPAMIGGIALGLHHGPTGVATGYSIATVLIAVPVIAWTLKGTSIKTRDFWGAIKSPLFSGMVACCLGILFASTVGPGLPQIPRLLIGLSLVFGTYLSILLFAMGQWGFYSDLIAHFFKRR